MRSFGTGCCRDGAWTIGISPRSRLKVESAAVPHPKGDSTSFTQVITLPVSRGKERGRLYDDENIAAAAAALSWLPEAPDARLLDVGIFKGPRDRHLVDGKLLQPVLRQIAALRVADQDRRSP